MNSINPADDTNCIETEFSDILTLNSCTTLISELIKFILYRKEQLPYTFDRLKYLVTKKNLKEKQKTVLHSASAVAERQFKMAEDGLKTLELMFEKTKEELANSNGGCVSEVVLLFGSTPMTPKQVYRIHLPKIYLTHSSVNHPERKHLIHLLRSVILSNNLYNMLRQPLSPTNMFVFIKKNLKQRPISKSDNSNEWFIPKIRFEIPEIGQHFHIKFRHPNLEQQTACCCKNFKIYSDNEKALEKENENSVQSPVISVWYQACAIFKGFADVYINGVSVANMWLR